MLLYRLHDAGRQCAIRVMPLYCSVHERRAYRNLLVLVIRAVLGLDAEVVKEIRVFRVGSRNAQAVYVDAALHIVNRATAEIGCKVHCQIGILILVCKMQGIWAEVLHHRSQVILRNSFSCIEPSVYFYVSVFVVK